MKFVLNSVHIEPKVADITKENADAIVASTNSTGKMPGGVTLALKKAGGQEIEDQAMGEAPIAVGDSVVTDAGKLQARFVIHACVVKRPVDRTTPDIVASALSSALSRANDLSLGTILIPGLGTGIAGVPKAMAAKAMVKAIEIHVNRGTTLRKITLVDLSTDLVGYWVEELQAIPEARKMVLEEPQASRYALVIVDLIKDFVREGGLVPPERARSMVQNINRLLSVAREKALPIFLVRDCHYPNDREFVKTKVHALVNSDGVKFIEDLQLKSSDFVVEKHRYSAFHETDLDLMLRNSGVTAIVVVGIQAHVCVMTTAIDGFYRNYTVLVPKECVESSKDDRREWALWYVDKYVGKVLSIEETIALLGG